jgi:hypothetical protein
LFHAKESNNLAFMATLAEPPLGALSITPRPFAIQPMNFTVSLFYDMASPCCTIRAWKVSRKAKKFFGHLVHLFFIHFLLLCLGRLVHL